MICTVAQQKGGVGKTTSAINLAALLAQTGRRVLAVDVDPQFALTRRLGIELITLESTVVDVLAGWVDVGEAIVSGVHGFDVLPASRELAGVELALAGEVSRETVLREALDGLGYDAIVIDTPSNLGLLTVNALVAADAVGQSLRLKRKGLARATARTGAGIHAHVIGPRDLRARARRGTEPSLQVLGSRDRRGGASYDAGGRERLT